MIPFFLLVIAGISNAIMDTLQFHFSTSRFSQLGEWWNPVESWKRKWKNGNRLDGERFPGSSTVFVFVTDAWHFFKSITFTSMALSIVFYNPAFTWWLDFILYDLTFSLSFELSFRIMKKTESKFWNWIKSNGVLATRLILILSFFLSFAVYKLLGGDGSYSWGIPETGALFTVIAGLVLFFSTIFLIRKKP